MENRVLPIIGRSVSRLRMVFRTRVKMNNNLTFSWDSVRDSTLADPEVKAEFDELRAEFEFARTIISLREKVGLTQREFANKVGMKQSQLARIESGKQTPKLQTLAKLAAVAGYEIEVNLIPMEQDAKK